VTSGLGLAGDVRHGFRLLRMRPLLSSLAVAILALGIGSTVAVFSFVDRLLLRDPPYREPGRVVTFWQTTPDAPAAREGVSPGAFLAWREQATSFETFAAVEPWSFTYLSDAEPQSLLSVLVTERFFEAIGTQPMLGRTFRPDEHVSGRANVVILSYGAWQRLLGSDANAVGRTIQLDGRAFEVVGVLPRSFDPDMPPGRTREVFAPKVVQEFERRSFRSRYWAAVGRLKPGVTQEQARQEVAAVSAQLARENPRAMSESGALAVPLNQHLAGETREPLLVLLGAIVVVLLIACANVANLLLALAAERRREFTMRTALGAGPARIVRQVMIESFSVALLASAGGLAIAAWAIDIIAAMAPGDVPQIDQVGLDFRVLAFAIGLTLVTTCVFGLTPALQAARPALRDAIATSSQSPARRKFASILVVAEVSLTLLLLVGAGLLLKSFVSLASVDVGFARSNVVALQVFAYGQRYNTPARTLAFFDETAGRMRGLPGVDTVGLVSAMPFLPSNIGIELPFQVEGRPASSPSEMPTAFVTIATGEYFRAMQVPLRAGRVFEDRDLGSTRPVALVNELFARRHLGLVGTDLDQATLSRLRVTWQGKPLTVDIVGVVGQTRHDGFDREPRPELFLPLAQVPFGSMTFVARTAGDPAAVVPALKSAVWAIDSAMPFYMVATIDSLLSQSLSPRRFLMWLLSGFAACAFALAAAGIYGVLTFSTLQRTREMGIRIAMGARAGDITRLVVREGMTLVAIGIALGLAGSAAIARGLSSLLFGVSPLDPITLAAAILLLGSVALAACYLPARRATRVDPLLVLKAE
jgi:putative ABC transport system permease protein